MSYPNYFRYWGKARSLEGSGPGYHLLPYHCLDVAAVGEVWWSSTPNLRRQFKALVDGEIDEASLRAWVLFFIALHDPGRFDVRFQMKAANVLLNLLEGHAQSL